MNIHFEYLEADKPPVVIPALFPGNLSPEQVADIVEQLVAEPFQRTNEDRAEWPLKFWFPNLQAWLCVYRMGPRLVYSREATQ